MKEEMGCCDSIIEILVVMIFVLLIGRDMGQLQYCCKLLIPPYFIFMVICLNNFTKATRYEA
jgi:hypothetical protein